MAGTAAQDERHTGEVKAQQYVLRAAANLSHVLQRSLTQILLRHPGGKPSVLTRWARESIIAHTAVHMPLVMFGRLCTAQLAAVIVQSAEAGPDQGIRRFCLFDRCRLPSRSQRPERQTGSHLAPLPVSCAAAVIAPKNRSVNEVNAGSSSVVAEANSIKIGPSYQTESAVHISRTYWETPSERRVYNHGA